METRRLWRMWWSGLFALVSASHLIRSLGGIPVTIGTVSIPLWLSWVVFPIAGAVSGWLMSMALRGGWYASSPSWREALGAPHPEASEPPEARSPGQPYCGVHAGYHTVGEDDEEE
mgnify:CR=1 FL=1